MRLGLGLGQLLRIGQHHIASHHHNRASSRSSRMRNANRFSERILAPLAHFSHVDDKQIDSLVERETEKTRESEVAELFSGQARCSQKNTTHNKTLEDKPKLMNKYFLLLSDPQLSQKKTLLCSRGLHRSLFSNFLNGN